MARTSPGFKDALLADEALEVGADEGVMLCEEERSEEKYEKFCRAKEGIRNMAVSLSMELSFCDDGVCKFQPQWIKKESWSLLPNASLITFMSFLAGLFVMDG